jgi:predicted nucleotidyltransferase component of viral defense system
MTIDIAVHKTILFQILKAIYSDPMIAPFLGLKGGTAAALFYGLDRFSVDLDFDLLREDQEGVVFERVIEIIGKFGTLKETHQKRFNLFCLLSYEDRARHIKVEINKRQFGSEYEINSYLGVSMLVMVKADMVAHKFMAMYERIGKTSRDIYDVWFFLNQRFPINKEIIEKRANMPFNKLVEKCLEKLQTLSDRKILDGLGELLTPHQKDWARSKLKKETISLLRLRMGIPE